MGEPRQLQPVDQSDSVSEGKKSIAAGSPVGTEKTDPYRIIVTPFQSPPNGRILPQKIREPPGGGVAAVPGVLSNHHFGVERAHRQGEKIPVTLRLKNDTGRTVTSGKGNADDADLSAVLRVEHRFEVYRDTERKHGDGES